MGSFALGLSEASLLETLDDFPGGFPADHASLVSFTYSSLVK